jgi:plastocyanin
MLALALVFPVAGQEGQKGKDRDKDRKPPAEAFVQFAQLVSPAPAAGSLAGTLTHFLFPDDVSIRKGGTVTFIVNNGGHGIAIHRVSRNTTREDIAEDLCQGPPGSAESDRAARFTLCQGTQANLAYRITDGDGEVVIDAPANVANSNPRLDDPDSSDRLLATSGRSRGCAPGEAPPTCDPTFGDNPAGGFLAGNVVAIPTATPPVAQAVGNRIRVRFEKSGRYLVICMNRAHSLNDHMFGFVNVGNIDEDEDGGHGRR